VASDSARWPDVEPIGVLYFVLGPEIGSAESYPRFTSAARASGFITATVHPRGAGYSDRTRGDIDDYALFLADLELGVAWGARLRVRTRSIAIA
jgi:alpha-beta hydrolase superfamily lysophospholipase